MRFLYGHPFGQWLVQFLLSRRILSVFVGWYQSSFLSRGRVERFIRDYSISMQDYEPGPFKSFNHFFIRNFAPGIRPTRSRAQEMPAPCEARYYAWDSITDDLVLPVKGRYLQAAALMGDEQKARWFVGGPLLLARLCPVDYHRFHFPDAGRVTAHYRIPGRLHSVNPLALKYRGDIFCINERQVTILETENFGRIAYIEVGALCVGKIVQTHDLKKPYARSAEKGYFLFGGSTVILLGEKGKWKPAPDLLDNTRQGLETWVPLGDLIANQTTQAPQ